MSGILEFLKSKKVPKLEIIEDNGFNYESQVIGNIKIPDSLTEYNAFKLANSIAELYFPIDFIADRVSKIRFYIVDKSGKELENSELNRFVNSINPLYSFSDLVYQYIFSILADGNSYTYRKVSDIYKKISVDSISRIDILHPEFITLSEYNNVSVLDISKLTDLIRKAKYNQTGTSGKQLEVENLIINKIDSSYRTDSLILSKSVLFKASQSINNLLATYSARYNVYVNNGAAGYLVKKATKGNAEAEAVDPITRDTILADINDRNGITGRRNLWGISSVPIEFINTLADIQKLQPFDETLEDSIKIAGVFQIPAYLIPRKDGSTFSNLAEAERAVWENSIMSMVELFCLNYTKICTLDLSGHSIKADYSSVSCLENSKIEQKNIIADSDKKTADNKILLYEKGIIKYNQMLEYIGEEAIEGGDKYIYDMTKVPYSTKLGVGGTQSLQMLISDPNISSDTKYNTLIVVYGLTEAEARQIISI